MFGKISARMGFMLCKQANMIPMFDSIEAAIMIIAPSSGWVRIRLLVDKGGEKGCLQ